MNKPLSSTLMRQEVSTEAQTRIDLAAAFRWTARLNWHESIANHFSAAVSQDGSKFLLNPNGRHFSRVRASELLLLDAKDPSSAEGPNAPDPTAWHLHAQLHRLVPRARCILHTHMPNALALCCVKDYEFLMLDQNACRYYQRIAYDRDYNGMALDESEGMRVARLLGDDKNVLFMGNHGVMAIGATVAEAFDELYYLERASAVQILALSTGRESAVIPDAIAAKTQGHWFEYPTAYANLHFNAIKEILDEEEPSYKQ
jgi:ribulose-5-phosphate 4-epimerase/fuculose-1-phosphate aldolase